MSEDPSPPRATYFAPDSEILLSDDDLEGLYPRSVRPAVIGTLWALLVVLLIVFGFLAIAYSRIAG
jgi:hypothetical protein